MKTRTIVPGIALLLSINCGPMVIDLSGSKHLVDKNRNAGNTYDYKVVILNKAPDMVSDSNIFGARKFAMRTAEKPKDTLENDIKTYLDKLSPGVSNNRRIVARIDKADAYWIEPGVNTIPFVGLITMFAPQYPFVFDISIDFEIEERGKIVKTYKFAQKFEVPDGSALTVSGIEDGYRRVVSMYRKSLFESLELEFAPRYLESTPSK